MLSVFMIFYNTGVAWYITYMINMYYTMASRNMHAVEDSIIGSVYDKLNITKSLLRTNNFTLLEEINS